MVDRERVKDNPFVALGAVFLMLALLILGVAGLWRLGDWALP